MIAAIVCGTCAALAAGASAKTSTANLTVKSIPAYTISVTAPPWWARLQSGQVDGDYGDYAVENAKGASIDSYIRDSPTRQNHDLLRIAAPASALPAGKYTVKLSDHKHPKQSESFSFTIDSSGKASGGAKVKSDVIYAITAKAPSWFAHDTRNAIFGVFNAKGGQPRVLYGQNGAGTYTDAFLKDDMPAGKYRFKFYDFRHHPPKKQTVYPFTIS